MRKLLLLLFVIFNITSVSKSVAQLKDNYTIGNITLTNGQKIKGYIKQQDLEKSREKVFYKTSPEDKQYDVYLSNQVQQVSLETGAIYELLTCIIPKSNDTVSFLASLLLRGNASLYETSYNQNHVYIVNKDKTYWLQEDEIEDGQLVKYYYQNILFSALSGNTITERDIEQTNFNDKELIRLIMKYNQSTNSVSELIEVENKSIAYLIAGAGGMYKDATDNEFYIQVVYRNYFPWISRNTSLNIGLSYFRNVYETDESYANVAAIRSLYTLPFYIQQNLLNKKVRPYLFGGLNLSYITEESKENNISLIQEGFQKNYGMGFLLGVGIEADVLKSFIVKGEYRYENFPHLLMFGIAYRFQL